MRPYGALHPTELIPVPPDTVGVANISTALAVAAFDFPSGADLVAFGSTANFWCDMQSTSVAIPTTTENGSTSVLSEYLRDGVMYQIPGDSTGGSITAASSGIISLSYWSRP